MRNYFTRSERASRREHRRVRLHLEALEDRTVLSPMVFTVNSLNDNGTGTGNTGDLRYCINQANQNGNTSNTPDVIKFAPVCTAPLRCKRAWAS